MLSIAKISGDDDKELYKKRPLIDNLFFKIKKSCLLMTRFDGSLYPHPMYIIISIGRDTGCNSSINGKKIKQLCCL